MPVYAQQQGQVAGVRVGQIFPFALACYFLLQAAIRISQPGMLQIDEAEMVVQAQQLQLGYDAQPPLYVWLQWLFFEMFGVGLAGLSLLKNALQFGIYLSVYQCARRLLGPLAGAAIATSLAMIVPLGWEAQIDRTHSILVTTCAAFALWAYLVLLDHPHSRLLRIVLGILFGLGMMSKYNFAIFALGLATASLMVGEHRKAIWTRDLWLTVLAALLTMLPHAWWFVQNLEAATGPTLGKMQLGGSGYLFNVSKGFQFGILAVASFITPLWIALALAYRSPKQGTWRRHTSDARFFIWLYGTGLACIVVLILSGQLAHIKSRWLQPLLFSIPLAAFVLFPPKTDRVYHRQLWIACNFAAVLTVLLYLRPQIQIALERDQRIHQPFPELAAELIRRFPQVKAIAVADRYLGGNIRLQTQHVPMLLLENACAQMPTIGGPVIFIAQSEAQAYGFLGSCPGLSVTERGKISVVRASKHKLLRFDYLIIESGKARSAHDWQ